MISSSKLRVGISACLLGFKVRYDGRDGRGAPFVLSALGSLVEWVTVCPELELGMGVPREPIRLVGDPASPRLVGVGSGKDHTEAMLRFAEARAKKLRRLGLAGFVTKNSSPSCGLSRVLVHGENGEPPRLEGVGLFVRALKASMPALPVEEEGRLRDPLAREKFMGRVFAYARFVLRSRLPQDRSPDQVRVRSRGRDRERERD